MKHLVKISSILATILVSNFVHAHSTSINDNTTVEETCFIEGNNINFGTISMPLTDTSLQSLLKTKCVKNFIHY